MTNKFMAWQRGLLAPLNAALVSEELPGSPGSVAQALHPLVTPVATRHMFFDCSDGWVLLLDNFVGGTNPALAAVLSTKCRCMALRVVSRPHTMRAGSGSYGAEILESFLSGERQRTVYCANDGGRWKFGQEGPAYPVEDTARYERLPVRERFTRGQLLAILDYLEVRAWDEDWYPKGEQAAATLVTRVGCMPTNYRQQEE